MVHELLTEGAENARTAKYLCGLLGFSARELSKTIERERRQGKPICASTGTPPGYFLAANQYEMRQFCDSLAHRAKEIHKTRRACAKTIDTLPQEE